MEEQNLSCRSEASCRIVSENRRKVLKILAVSSGAVAASAVLPARWVRPIIDVGVLPAHAGLSCLNVAGTWNITVQIIDDLSEPCSPPEADTQSGTATVTQDGCHLVGVGQNEDGTYEGEGTLIGNRVSLDASYVDGDGTTVETGEIVFGPGGDTMNGNSSWTWTPDNYPTDPICKGTVVITGNRTSP